MGGDSCSKGREFESWHHILDGNFFTYVVVVNFLWVFEKEAGVGTFKKKLLPTNILLLKCSHISVTRFGKILQLW